MVFFNSQPTKVQHCNDARHKHMETKVGHFCARVHGPTKWPRLGFSSAGHPKVLLHGQATSALGSTGPPNGSDLVQQRWGYQPHGLWLFPRRGYRLRLRRRSRALLHEPPHVHVWGVGQVASIQMIELIRPPGSVVTQHLSSLELKASGASAERSDCAARAMHLIRRRKPDPVTPGSGMLAWRECSASGPSRRPYRTFRTRRKVT